MVLKQTQKFTLLFVFFMACSMVLSSPQEIGSAYYNNRFIEDPSIIYEQANKYKSQGKYTESLSHFEWLADNWSNEFWDFTDYDILLKKIQQLSVYCCDFERAYEIQKRDYLQEETVANLKEIVLYFRLSRFFILQDIIKSYFRAGGKVQAFQMIPLKKPLYLEKLSIGNEHDAIEEFGLIQAPDFYPYGGVNQYYDKGFFISQTDKGFFVFKISSNLDHHENLQSLSALMEEGYNKNDFNHFLEVENEIAYEYIGQFIKNNCKELLSSDIQAFNGYLDGLMESGHIAYISYTMNGNTTELGSIPPSEVYAEEYSESYKEVIDYEGTKLVFSKEEIYEMALPLLDLKNRIGVIQIGLKINSMKPTLLR